MGTCTIMGDIMGDIMGAGAWGEGANMKTGE
jgi:hypothetical protein